MKKLLAILTLITSVAYGQTAEQQINKYAAMQTATIAAQQRTIDSLKSLLSKPVPPVTVTPPPSSNIVYVGDGKSQLTIDGNITKYPAGTQIVVKPGTYYNSIDIANLTGVTVVGAGVILDGLNKTKDGYYNVLTLDNLTNCVVSGFTTQNVGYFSLYINTKLSGTTLTGFTFNNCGIQGWNCQDTNIWDGTDASAFMLNCKILNCTFIGASIGGTTGGISNGVVTNVIKNLEIANCTISANDYGEFFTPGMMQGGSIHDNVISNFNPTNNNDNRLFKITGYCDFYNNKFDSIAGHAFALWPCTLGSAPSISHCYNNSVNNSRRYAAFEMQEFLYLNVAGKTSKSDLVVNNNVVTNINTDKWTGYPCTFIDNYQGFVKGTLGSLVTLTNNTGKNWYPIPKLPVLWNLAAPAVYSGNVYN